jgi:hypothetical protein
VLKHGTTVFDDMKKDKLEGGLQRDWIFKFGKDRIKSEVSLPDILDV